MIEVQITPAKRGKVTSLIMQTMPRLTHVHVTVHVRNACPEFSSRLELMVFLKT